MVGRGALDSTIEVRVLVPQPCNVRIAAMNASKDYIHITAKKGLVSTVRYHT